MFDYIKGVFTYKTAGSKGCFATLEAAGVGYRFEITERDYSNLPELNTEIKMYSVLLHREDKMSFCGFLRRDERDIFNILVSVSGVGSKMALTLLNSFEVSDLVGFVLEGNYKELTRAKGVGPKLAQKIILELKDKLTNYEGTQPVKSVSRPAVISSQNIEDAQTVLLSLGYNNDEINFALEKTMSKIPQSSSAEEILRESLRVLSL
jgi:Holliday junction DNA helicase RuvA